jgi:ABC-type nitrate/sulfonate/bicarbonate transport system permease component
VKVLDRPVIEPTIDLTVEPAPLRGAGRPRRRRLQRSLQMVLPPLILVVILVVVWNWYVTSHHVSPQVLPSPGRVISEGWNSRADIWDNTKPTIQITVIGFAVSLCVAWFLAVVIDFSGFLRRALMPVLVASQTLPIIVIAPLMIIWFGFGIFPKVIVIALVTFFPITIALIEGFDSAEREATNLLRSMGANKWKRFRYVRLPSSLPYFFAGLRIAITYAVVGAIFAEYVGAFKGLGIYMLLQKNSFRTDLVLAAVLVVSALSISLFLLTYLLQRIAIPWHAKAKKAGRT